MTIKMKDSGIGWVHDIPEHWEVLKGKYLFTSSKEVVGARVEEYERLALTLNGVIKRSKEDNDGLQPAKFDTYQILKENELVFKLIDLQNISTSRVGLSSFTGIVSPAYIILKSNAKIDPSFAEKYYLMMWLHEVFNALGDSGVRSSLNASELLELRVPVPPIEEQIKIRNFLNEELEKINIAIKNISTQIEILENYKKSTVTELITRGLQKNVKKKETNIPWIGSIPAHWRILRGKYFLINLKKPIKDDDGVVTCFRDGEVTLRTNRREDGFTMSTKEIGYQGIDIGDLAVHSMDGFAGAIGISDSRGKASPVLSIIDTHENKKYVMYFLRSMAYNDVFIALSTGIRVRSTDLRWNKLIELYYPLPPISEQHEIVSEIDRLLENANKLIRKKEEQIEVLERLKKSLMYEYVTGKVGGI